MNQQCVLVVHLVTPIVDKNLETKAGATRRRRNRKERQKKVLFIVGKYAGLIVIGAF